MSKICPKCNLEINDDSNYCPHCGNHLNTQSTNELVTKRKTREEILKEKFSVEELNYQIATLRGIRKMLLVFAIISTVLASIYFLLVIIGLILYANNVSAGLPLLTFTYPFFILFLLISVISFVLRETLIAKKIHKRELIINIISKQ